MFSKSRPLWRRSFRQEPWRRFQFSLVVVVLVILTGWLGYQMLGLDSFDALYQTVITITTVGYSEIGSEVANLRAYRVFSLFLVVLGTGSVLYTLGLLADSLIEGGLNAELQKRKMLKAIDELEGHTIIAGWGQVGHAVADFVSRSGEQVVVVDREPTLDESEYPVVVGEATDDDVLLSAGIERAKTLVLALDHDADNLFVCLSARSLRKDLFIVARTSDQRNEAKFFQAGADRVLDPHQIGGSRMAVLALRPYVAEFLDEVLHDDQHDVSVEEIRVPRSSSMVGKPLVELRDGNGKRPLIIAIRTNDGRYHTNPAPKTKIVSGDVLITLGSSEEISLLRRSF